MCFRAATARRSASRLGLMRIAIDFFTASPTGGRPRGRNRLSCSSVSSGESEKSISLSGGCLNFFPARRTSSDDADGFDVICPPQRVSHFQHALISRVSDENPPQFDLGVGQVFDNQATRVFKNGNRLFKRNAAFRK